MSEEEIIKTIEDYIDNGMTNKTVKIDTFIYLNEAIKELYNMYQKEKEKNKKVITYIKEKQKIQYKYALSQIECDKILELLEEE